MRRILTLLMLLPLWSSSADAAHRPFRAEQYALLPALALTNYLLFDVSPPSTARWTGGVLFDDGLRDGLRFRSKSARSTISTLGDITLVGLTAFPIVVDAFADTWMSKKDGETAGQLSLIATQAFLMTGALRLFTKVVVGRERPYQRECAGDPDYDGDCGAEPSRTSFFSGHAAMSFTAAGLICSAREHLSLVGGSAPCYVALGLATGISLSRILADKHYATDTLMGMAVGLMSGYFLPKWMHFGDSVTPAVSSNGMGLNFMASW